MNIQDEELKYKKEETISFFGTKLDVVTLTMFIGGIILSILTWVYLGLYNYGYNKYFLYALCIFFVIQIYSSGTYVASYTVEDNEIKEVVQLNAVIFSSLVILLAFSVNFEPQDNKMIVIALFYCILGILYYSSPKDGKAKRMIRKMKTAFMTITIFIFMNMLFNMGVRKFGLLQESN